MRREVNQQGNPIRRFFWLLCLLACLPTSMFADDIKSYRIDVGLKLFKTLVAADENLGTQINAQGNLRIALLHVDDLTGVEALKATLESTWPKVNQQPVSIELLTIDQLKQQAPPNLAAIFVAQELLEPERALLIAHSLKHKTVFFSPFEGDVEAGVLAGLSVQATVRPLLNRSTLTQGGYAIKPFYLKVAKYHE